MNPQWNGQFSRFDLVARTQDCVRTIVLVRDIAIGGDDFVVMAGPCAGLTIAGSKTPACRLFIGENEKALLQFLLEGEFAKYEDWVLNTGLAR